MTFPNDYAFSKPAYVSEQGVVDSPQQGLTKREYFAAMAMQGILSNSPDWTDSDHCLNWVSESSVKFSDALIEALNKTK